jgi:Family of unknown function (DUF6768)
MRNTEENIDKLIREALTEEETRAFEDLGEQSIIGMALGVFSGRNRYLTFMMGIVMLALFVAAVYSGIQAFDTVETNSLIRWMGAFFLFTTGTMLLKLWTWMEMEKNATIREMKRIELQIANLAMRLSKDRE